MKATSWLGGDRIHATVLMLVDRPGRLRLEAEVSLQGTVAILATDTQRFAFLDTQHNELRRGAACPANVASLIRIPLGPVDVAAILLGDVHVPADRSNPESAGAYVPTVDWDGDRRVDVLVLPGSITSYRLFFERRGPGDFRLVGATELDHDGRPRWRTAYESFTSVPTGKPGGGAAVDLPQTIRFAEHGGSFDDGVEIKFKERTLNEEAAAGAFDLPAPKGATVLEVACPAGG